MWTCELRSFVFSSPRTCRPPRPLAANFSLQSCLGVAINKESELHIGAWKNGELCWLRTHHLCDAKLKGVCDCVTRRRLWEKRGERGALSLLCVYYEGVGHIRVEISINELHLLLLEPTHYLLLGMGLWLAIAVVNIMY